MAAPPCAAAGRQRERSRQKNRFSAAGVNDCAGFLHTLTTGFNRDALIVHISAGYRRLQRPAAWLQAADAPGLNF